MYDSDEILQHVAQFNQLPPDCPWERAHDVFRTRIQQTLALAADNHNQDAQNFEAENAYLLEQFDLLEAPTFTLQRLAEVLLDPRRYHIPVSHPEGPLRGEKLQAALRRCILVSPLE